MTLKIAVALMASGLLAATAAAQTPPSGRTSGEGSSDGLNRRVRIHNQTGLPVRQLQAADVRTGEYAPDLLAGSPIEPGASRPVTIDAGTNVCLFDLRAELSSREVLTRENVNVCRLADFYLTR